MLIALDTCLQPEFDAETLWEHQPRRVSTREQRGSPLAYHTSLMCGVPARYLGNPALVGLGNLARAHYSLSDHITLSLEEQLQRE